MRLCVWDGRVTTDAGGIEGLQLIMGLLEQVTTDDEPVCVGWEGNNWCWGYRGVTTDDGVIGQVTTDDGG